MRKGRRGRQTKSRAKSGIRWGRVLLLFLVFGVQLGLLYTMYGLLEGGDSLPFGIALPGLLAGNNPSAADEGAQAPSTPSSPAPPETQETLAAAQAAREPMPEIMLAPAESADPAAFGFTTGLEVDKEEVPSFSRESLLSFADGGAYASIPGVLTFGGNAYRNSFTYGEARVAQRTLVKKWEIPLGSLRAEDNALRSSLGDLTGTGFTGMPLLAEWPAQTRAHLGIGETFKQKEGFVEAIVPAMDGNIYFMDLETGEQTREPIALGVIMKGGAALDPRGYPLLYVGQSIPSTSEDGTYGAWMRVIDLITNEVVWSFGGRDRFAYRAWQGYSASPLVHAETDTLLVPGENGALYTLKLNSRYDEAAGEVTLAPGPLEKYRYTGDGYAYREQADRRWVGFEGSLAVFRQYGFLADNGGRLQCIDLNSLQLQYVVDITDNTDSTPVIEEDAAAGTFYLYTANTVDKQAGAASARQGKALHRKIDGRTGEVLWERAYTAAYGTETSHGGTYATPHVGRGSIAGLVIYSMTMMHVTYEQEGAEQESYGGWIIAYDKNTGEEVWRHTQQNNYWSSPAVVYDENETAYLIQGDRDGKLQLWDPLAGTLLFELDLGSAIESTPSVFGNMLVVGTRGTFGAGEQQKIFGVEIR